MDPERPIEKLLRQAAQARRGQAGAPQELHPATRRMLQGEVARKFASGAPRERRSFFELFMPRLAWGAALLIGLGLAASLMLPRKNASRQEMLFAKNDRLSTVASANESKTRAAVPSEKAAVASQPDSSALGRANSARLVDAERDKDSLNVERRQAQPQKQSPLALNEPAAAPVSPALKAEGGAADGTARQHSETQLHTAATAASSSLAKEKQKEQLADSYTAAPPAQPPVTEENVARRRFYGLTQPAQSAPSTAAPPGVAGAAASPVLRAEAAKSELAYKSAPTAAAPASASLGGQLKSADSVDVAKKAPAPITPVTQKFVQATLNKGLDLSDKSGGAQPILFSFELQQVGRTVQIVDSDGSVYSGSFQSPQTFNYLDSTASEKAAGTRSLQEAEAPSKRKDALSDSKLQTDQSFAFKVTGTNQTSKQVVTFTGEVVAPTNALSVLGVAGTVNGNRVAPPELNPLPLRNSRISGRALIGTNKEIEVNAIPAQ